MKLVKEANAVCLYQMDPQEAAMLQGLVKNFPFTAMQEGEISRTEATPEALERDKLLNESLVEYRESLTTLAAQLVAPERFKPQAKGVVMTISSEERERLLQILNDIRVGCWNALGQPASLEPPASGATDHEHKYFALLNLAGYFEHSLLVGES